MSDSWDFVPFYVFFYLTGSRGGGEREPGTHRSCMRLIISNFCRFLRHRRLPTAMLRNNIKGAPARKLYYHYVMKPYCMRLECNQ